MQDIKLKYNAKNEDTNAVTVESVTKMVVETGKAFRTAKAKAQYTAVAVMVLAVKFPAEATKLANDLVHTLGDGVKGEGMVKWLEDRGGFRLSPEKKEGFVSVKNEEWIKANLQAAKDTPWWSYAPASPFKGFHLVGEITKILDRADKMAKEKDVDKAEMIDVDVAMLSTLRSLIGGAPISGDDALALVQKLVPDNVLSFPAKEEESTEHPELPAEKAEAKG